MNLAADLRALGEHDQLYELEQWIKAQHPSRTRPTLRPGPDSHSAPE
jgi:glutaredoxin